VRVEVWEVAGERVWGHAIEMEAVFAIALPPRRESRPGSSCMMDPPRIPALHARALARGREGDSDPVMEPATQQDHWTEPAIVLRQNKVIR
jgi:hypothetical protein